MTAELGEPVTFDSRVWIGTTAADVVDYLSWRQAGRSARQATSELESRSKADKNELLFRHGVNFNDVPAWQRRGIGLWWESYPHEGFDPVREVGVVTTRRRIRTEPELPTRDDYRELIGGLVS